MGKGIALRDLMGIASRASSRYPGEELNPWILSQILPPFSLIVRDGAYSKEDRKRDNRDHRSSKNHPLRKALNILIGIERGKISPDHWSFISEKVTLPNLFRDYVNELSRALKELYGQDRVIERVYVTKRRFFIGIGGSSAWEAGIASLTPFGVPWIPGSSLKGALRSKLLSDIVEDVTRQVKGEKVSRVLYLLDVDVDGVSKEDNRGKAPKLENLSGDELKGVLKSLESEGIPHTAINRIKMLFHLFGSKKSEGELISFGGFPLESEKGFLDVDVINPHYSRYYRSDPRNPVPPGDWDEPRPFFYPVVREGVSFKFLLVTPSEEGKRRLVSSLLYEVLTSIGLGARTGSDYGIFRERGER